MLTLYSRALMHSAVPRNGHALADHAPKKKQRWLIHDDSLSNICFRLCSVRSIDIDASVAHKFHITKVAQLR